MNFVLSRYQQRQACTPFVALDGEICNAVILRPALLVQNCTTCADENSSGDLQPCCECSEYSCWTEKSPNGAQT